MNKKAKTSGYEVVFRNQPFSAFGKSLILTLY